MNTGSWNCPHGSIVELLERGLRGSNSWNYVAPQLRQLNRHWRDALDHHGYQVCMKKLRDYPLCKELPSILRRKTVTELHGYPQYAHIFKVDKLGNQTVLRALQKLQLKGIDNGDAVLCKICQWQLPSLRFLELDHVLLCQEAFNSLSKLNALKELSLRKLRCLESLDYGSLRELKTLTSLAIRSCDSCRSLQFLHYLTHLKSFVFETTTAERVEQLSTISSLPSLNELSIVMDCSRDAVFDVFVFPSSLTSLKADSHFLEAVMTTLPAGLKRLAFQSRMTGNLVSSLDGGWIGNFNDTYPWSLDVGLHMMTMEIMESLDLKSLEAIDLSNAIIEPCTLKSLTECMKLKQLRLHMTKLMSDEEMDDSSIDDVETFKFGALEILTINLTSAQLDVVTTMEMPLLNQVGIWLDVSCSCSVVVALNRLHSFSSVSFAANATPEDPNFHNSLCEALATRETSLKHIGWNQYGHKRSELPEFLIAWGAERSVLIDEDATVFIQ